MIEKEITITNNNGVELDPADDQALKDQIARRTCTPWPGLRRSPL